MKATVDACALTVNNRASTIARYKDRQCGTLDTYHVLCDKERALLLSGRVTVLCVFKGGNARVVALNKRA